MQNAIPLWIALSPFERRERVRQCLPNDKYLANQKMSILCTSISLVLITSVRVFVPVYVLKAIKGKKLARSVTPPYFDIDANLIVKRHEISHVLFSITLKVQLLNVLFIVPRFP